MIMEHHSDRGSIMFSVQPRHTIAWFSPAVACPQCLVMTHLLVNRHGETACANCSDMEVMA
ncbi:hypothetical protein [Nitrospira sp. BLG_1]|uniref:hypothetical protein n=1 Tax=Nitrospira sp. BLG_1 TaxID=3395883 RepID=UPI0039BCD6BA